MFYLYCSNCDDMNETDNEDELIQCPGCGDQPMQITKSDYMLDYEDNLEYFEVNPSMQYESYACTCEDYPCCGH